LSPSAQSQLLLQPLTQAQEWTSKDSKQRAGVEIHPGSLF
jgi:hypothetical protein